MIDLFEIQCKFVENGCVFIGNWTSLQVHENICQYEDNEEIVCNGCDQWVQGRNRRFHNCTQAIGSRLEDIYVSILLIKNKFTLNVNLSSFYLVFSLSKMS